MVTDSDGRAITPYVLGPDEGIGSDVIEAGLADSPGSPVVGFVASAKAAGDPAETTISGVVLDNTSRPIEGVTVRLLETEIAVVTDDEGQFKILGAPVGTVQLLVDGSTANRPGSWPDLELDLVTIAGRDNSPNMPIYLLPIDLANGLAVSETEGGTLTLTDVPGFALEVEPGSVTFPGGGHSGIISVTPVHYDRVPMTPNFGQQPRLIVTIQPAGARFEPPARMTLPNVEGLAPGAVTEMYSFDHDLGHFVSIGPATVSEDGATLTSNPGVGIVKAGWHCGGDPAVTGAPHACPTCMVCSGTTCIPGCPASPGGASSTSEAGTALFGAATSCACSDGDTCTVNDHCDSGSCVGDPTRILSVQAQATPAETFAGDPVEFSVVVEQEHCSELTYEWDLGDGTTATGPTVLHTYQEPGLYRIEVAVKCANCDIETDAVVVLAKCTEVEITGADPDIGFICPGCEVQFTAATTPPGRTVYWSVDAVTTGGGAQIDQTGLLTTDPGITSGTVIVEASTAPGGNTCSARRALTVWWPPSDSDKKRGYQNKTHDEWRWFRTHPKCYTKTSGVPHLSLETAKHHPGVGPPEEGTRANAWFHAYGSCLVAAICDFETAKELFDAHEEYDTNNCPNASMDLQNNRVGRDVAISGSPQSCLQLVDEALNQGRLRWLDPVVKVGCPNIVGGQ